MPYVAIAKYRILLVRGREWLRGKPQMYDLENKRTPLRDDYNNYLNGLVLPNLPRILLTVLCNNSCTGTGKLRGAILGNKLDSGA